MTKNTKKCVKSLAVSNILCNFARFSEKTEGKDARVVEEARLESV